MNRHPLTVVIARLSVVAALGATLGCNAGVEDGPELKQAVSSATTADPETMAWQPVGSMTNSRYHFDVAVLGNGSVLAAGGWPATQTSEVFNPATGTWASGGNLSRARSGLILTRLNDGKVLASGGHMNNTYYTDAELYDPATNRWTPAAPMLLPRADHVATLLPNGKVLVAGGWTEWQNQGCPTESAELYDPATNTWSSAGSMPRAMTKHTATLLPNGKVLVAAGWDGFAALYEPGTNSWTSTGKMSGRRDYASATLLQGDKVLVVGGTTQLASDGLLATTELYDPTSNTWAPAAPIGTARAEHGAVRLDGGKVMIAGGRSSGGALASVELFDPATGAWTAGPSLTTARGTPMLERLPNGNVLAVGPDKTAEVYRTNEERELGSATGTVATGTTCGAFSDVAPSCGGANTASDIAFLWTAPKSASFTFSTYGSSLDTVLEVRNASTGALLGCNDDSDSMPESTLWLRVTAGQKVRIVVDGRGAACGNFQLAISESAWSPL